MHRRLNILAGFVVLVVLSQAIGARADDAENQGQADLDEAIAEKVSAASLRDLATVIDLCQSALDKGLDEGSTEFAKQLLSSTLLQRGGGYSRLIFDAARPDRRWVKIRELALADLERAAELQPDLSDAHLLIARLNALPGGDREKAVAALDEVLRLEPDDSMNRPTALLLRAELGEDPKQRLADYSAVLEQTPENVQALRGRGALQLEQRNLGAALADFEALVELAPDDARAHHALGLAQLFSEKHDEALASLNKSLELDENSASTLLHRASVHSAKSDPQAALADLDKALSIDPTETAARLLRATIYEQLDQTPKALADLDEALLFDPDLTPALRMRAVVLARMGKVDQGIADLEEVRRRAPDDVETILRLGMLHASQKQVDQAIETYNEGLEQDAENVMLLRARADAYLSVGKQREAIADYETAIAVDPTDDGSLNNLAWVLATSPNDELRDGARALEVAKRACEATEYKMAHILSTLAAAHAELGEFDQAIEWSTKALELSEENLRDPLTKELQSYQEGKPWRELQTGGEPTPGHSAEPEDDDDETPPAEPNPDESTP